MATVVRCVTSGSNTSGFVLMTRDIPEGIARAKQFLNVPLHVLCTFIVLVIIGGSAYMEATITINRQKS